MLVVLVLIRFVFNSQELNQYLDVRINPSNKKVSQYLVVDMDKGYHLKL